MRRPSKRLVVTFITSLIIGYGISWGIMVGILQTPYRLYGFTNLSLVALLVALLLIIYLDTPLNLHAFEWPKETDEKSGLAYNEE